MILVKDLSLRGLTDYVEFNHVAAKAQAQWGISYNSI